MSEMDNGQHLQTRYVFIDTEAFERARYDWKGKTLSKLVQFAREGYLSLLINDITKQEVISHLRERFVETTKAIKKHEIVIEQLGSRNIIDMLNDPTSFTRLEEAFDGFLRETKAIDVATVASIEEIFSDFFSRRPPFSDKKKTEFPDAVVMSSLKAWCAKQKEKAYVVSGDQDLKACCPTSGPLIYAETIEDIITQATVSKELRNALEVVIAQSIVVEKALIEQLQELIVDGEARSRRELLSGKVENAEDINIHHVDVLEQEGMTFTCEIEFEARLLLELEIKVRERFDYDDYYHEPARVYNTERSFYRSFGAEVVISFDKNKPDESDIESVALFTEKVLIDIDDLRKS